MLVDRIIEKEIIVEKEPREIEISVLETPLEIIIEKIVEIEIPIIVPQETVVEKIVEV